MEISSTTRRSVGRSVLRKKLCSHSDILDDDFIPMFFPKTAEDMAFIRDSLAGVALFDCLEDEERGYFIDAMYRQTVDPDVVIVQQGTRTDYLFLIEEGEVTYFTDNRKVGSSSRGSYFGDKELYHDTVCCATVISKTETKLWKIRHQDFRHMIASIDRRKNKETMDVLRRVSFLNQLDEERMDSITDKIIFDVVPASCPGGTVFRNKKVEKIFFVVKQGTVKVQYFGLSGNDVERICYPGDCFGELSILSMKRIAQRVTALAVTDCSLLTIRRNGFLEAINDADHQTKTLIRSQILKSVFELNKPIKDNKLNEFLDTFEQKIFKTKIRRSRPVYSIILKRRELKAKEENIEHLDKILPGQCQEFKRLKSNYDLVSEQCSELDKMTKRVQEMENYIKYQEYDLNAKIKDLESREKEYEQEKIRLELRRQRLQEQEDEVSQLEIEVKQDEKDLHSLYHLLQSMEKVLNERENRLTRQRAIVVGKQREQRKLNCSFCNFFSFFSYTFNSLI